MEQVRSDKAGKALKGVRFAPSPTGRFHLGNLRTARLSHRMARFFEEPWVVRFEDIDRPRVQAGALEQQLADLALLGMKPDVQALQSDRHAVHFAAWRQAVHEGKIYPCTCSRADVQAELGALASARNALPVLGTIERLPCYSGRCREGGAPHSLPAGKAELGWRFRSDADARGRFDFLVAKTRIRENFEAIRVEDFVPAYPWACALDDADGGYRFLVRAWDLAEAEFAQREIREWRLGHGVPDSQVFHAALVTRPDGGRLEKRTLGVTLSELDPAEVLRALDRSGESAARPIWEAVGAFPWGEAVRLISVADLLRSRV